MMLTPISRTWWLAALRGVLAIVFGVAVFVSPGLTFDVLVLLFGAYAFVDGVVVLSFGLMAAGEHGRWWPLVVGGIVGLAIGVLTFVQPAATALALVYVIGAWAIATAALALAFLRPIRPARRLRQAAVLVTAMTVDVHDRDGRSAQASPWSRA